MERLKLLILIFSVTALLTSCGGGGNVHQQHSPVEEIQAIKISGASTEAAAPFLTHDHLGDPVLCWTEKNENGKDYVLQFSRFDSITNSFKQPVTVQPSQGTRIHHESMNKVAFKKDGTVVAMYGEKHPTEENRFAGSIFYTLSSDEGKTWSSPDYLHSDTLPVYGRSFFDLARLPDGEIGAIWLDGRFGKDAIGSALFFAKTESGKGFGKDQQIASSTCECCRTDLFVDENGNLHTAYRSILFPSALRGEQVRDMVHSISRDGGKTFSKPQRISEDNWAIEGCPHTGPSLAANQEGLHAVWFTAGGQPGLYHVSSGIDNSNFSPRKMISKAGRHPQLISLPEGKMVCVWEEISDTSNKHELHASSAHTSTRGDGKSKSSSKIVLGTVEADGTVNFITVSGEGASATYPVVASLESDKVVVAWTQEEAGSSGVYYQVKELGK